MANKTACSQPSYFYTACNVDNERRKCNSFICAFNLSIFIIIAILSPVAVAGNTLILVAIWKRTFVRTPFHILLSGLAFTDLCTGLIVQPLVTVNTFSSAANPGIVREKPVLAMTLLAIGDVSATYFIAITILLIILMSVERWLHMSRRSLVTSSRGCLTVIILLLVPVPLVASHILDFINDTDGRELNTSIIASMLICYLITSFAYFKVYRIFRHHQQQVRANETSQNFGQQSIDLAKYKKTVASMLYILLLFSVCFLPYIVSTGVSVSVGYSPELFAVKAFSFMLVFLSSSLNPGLYVWRMNDIRNGVKHLLCRDG